MSNENAQADNIGVGSLQVNIEPQAAREAGAMWRVNQGQWRESGSLAGLAAVEHQVDFMDLPDWDKPGSTVVTVAPEIVSSRSFDYGLKGQTGSLQVLISPREAGETGKWRIQGSSQWQDSGHVQKNIEPGSYVIEFRPVSGWQWPADMVASVEKNHKTVLQAGYHEITWGCITVHIRPSDALTAGAMWTYQDAQGRYFPDGHMECGIPAGEHDILFKDIDGPASPDPFRVEVYPEQVSSFVGVYTLE